MRLLILSDLHREIWCRDQTRYDAWADPCPQIDLSVSKPDVVILAGDIDTGTRAIAWADEAFRGLPVLYVHGNHEGYGHSLDELEVALADQCESTGHIYCLNRAEHVIGSVRFLGTTLWTDFKLYGKEAYPMAVREAGNAMNDYRRIRVANKRNRLLKPSDTVHWHREQRSWLEERLAEPFDGKTVVVTHMAPSARSIAPEYQGANLTPAFASALDDLVERADLWVHGHTHSSADYYIGRCRVISNPLGYPRRSLPVRPENLIFDPNLVVEI